MRTEDVIYAVNGKIRLKAGREQEPLAMIGERDVATVGEWPDRQAVIGRAL